MRSVGLHFENALGIFVVYKVHAEWGALLNFNCFLHVECIFTASVVCDVKRNMIL